MRKFIRVGKRKLYRDRNAEHSGHNRSYDETIGGDSGVGLFRMDDGHWQLWLGLCGPVLLGPGTLKNIIARAANEIKYAKEIFNG